MVRVQVGVKVRTLREPDDLGVVDRRLGAIVSHVLHVLKVLQFIEHWCHRTLGKAKPVATHTKRTCFKSNLKALTDGTPMSAFDKLWFLRQDRRRGRRRAASAQSGLGCVDNSCSLTSRSGW